MSAVTARKIVIIAILKLMFNDSILSPSLVCQVVERLCQGEGRCTVAVTSHQEHCADR